MKKIAPRTILEKWLDGLSLIGIVLMLIYIGFMWSSLPHVIPTHFGFDGEADGFGGKGNIFIHPTVGLGFYILFHVLSRFPHLFNYPSHVTEEQKQQLYIHSRTLLGWLQFEIITFGVYSAWENVQIAMQREVEYSTISVVIFLGILFSTMIFYIVRSLRMIEK
ncbi:MULTISPECIES: DUF1648 domain-containing protein [unclassified Bacillus (in: firmicutes)]|uniref:DUF1648 domain-containing protein n=1 Tax=unclassified Bacillus (in: firmicutes) TaxID=185979 RepID=UPI0008F04EF5|nr:MULTISPECIES: DUF1648 domain-containing protein [unclassified Bacillus (in: firmicutes)]SFJ05978.1 Protein of unknown function [Bacillus sp. 71mf]SFS68023.1 Protein of unknown function [Bacillus sp. 103mf]